MNNCCLKYDFFVAAHNLLSHPPLPSTHPHTLTDEQAPDAPSNSPVRWDLIAAGICGTALLLAVVAVVGIATYAYRHKQKQRQRRCVLTNSLCELTDRPQNV